MPDNITDRDEATDYMLVLRLETQCQLGAVSLLIARTYIFIFT